MLTPFLSGIRDTAWAVFLIAFFFGGSIFVHELGHFLAARWKGLVIERFSIGFGPAIWSRRGKDGVEYRISWFPLGGYVLLPQLADMSLIEGESKLAEARPATSEVPYGAKMIVFVAGAVFNILFAFALAWIVSLTGQPVSPESMSTTIGYVTPTVELANGTKVASPASEARLKPGDRIVAIDGVPVHEWDDVSSQIVLGGGRDAAGHPEVKLQLIRDGQPLTIAVHPKLAGAEGVRQVGILPATPLEVYSVKAGSVADKAGFKAGDKLQTAAGAPIWNDVGLAETLRSHAGAPVPFGILRDGKRTQITLVPSSAAGANGYGLALTPGIQVVHVGAAKQIWIQVVRTFRNLGSLINPHSDVGLSKMSGVIGIVHIYSEAAQAGIVPILILTILINVNLAMLNLLPVPVLDGGHMTLATIAWIRGRSLPPKFIMATQSVFMALIVAAMLYIGWFDVARWVRG